MVCKRLGVFLRNLNLVSEYLSDLYAVPTTDLHLSILELSHQHTLAHLRAVHALLGPTLVSSMLNLPHRDPSAFSHRASSPSAVAAPKLVRPLLVFDQRGLALTFVPAAPAPRRTYHHLRAALQAHALSSGLAIDTCYTTATAHITLARFVGTDAFFDRDGGDGSAAAQRFVDLIHRVNEGLRVAWEAGDKDDGSWTVGGEAGLELQLGYLKFGRAREAADAVGAFAQEAANALGASARERGSEKTGSWNE